MMEKVVMEDDEERGWTLGLGPPASGGILWSGTSVSLKISQLWGYCGSADDPLLCSDEFLHGKKKKGGKQNGKVERNKINRVPSDI